MKKELKIYFLFATLFGLLGTPVLAYDFGVQNADGITLYYDYINEGKELGLARENSYNNYKELQGKVLRIPSEVTFKGRTRKVTQIQKYALAYALMTEVSLPPTIKRICSYAFYDCDRLKVLNIPDNTEIIEECILGGVRLNKITIGKGLKKVGRQHFGTTLISDSVIVKDLNSFLKIEYYDCNFFHWYAGDISKRLMFDSNYNLITDLVLPEGITKIGGSLKGCKSIRSVRIPTSITEIDDSAFCECKNLSNIYWHDNITRIGESAFEHCPISNVVLPQNLITIDDLAFSYCTLSVIEIPDKVERIGWKTFDGNNLEMVVLPQSLKGGIGIGAFYSSENLLTVISNIVNPALCPPGNYWGDGSFSYAFNKNTLMNATLYVPVGTKSKYESAKGWKDFVFIEEGIPNEIDVTNYVVTNNQKYYNLYGYPSSHPHKGINIERMSDGSIKKVFVK